jgi:hypothetical protein
MSAWKKKIVYVPICLFIGILLAGVIIPKLNASRRLALRNACCNHLGQIDAAKNQWALDHQKTKDDIPIWAD